MTKSLKSGTWYDEPCLQASTCFCGAIRRSIARMKHSFNTVDALQVTTARLFTTFEEVTTSRLFTTSGGYLGRHYADCNDIKNRRTVWTFRRIVPWDISEVNWYSYLNLIHFIIAEWSSLRIQYHVSQQTYLQVLLPSCPSNSSTGRSTPKFPNVTFFSNFTSNQNVSCWSSVVPRDANQIWSVM